MPDPEYVLDPEQNPRVLSDSIKRPYPEDMIVPVGPSPSGLTAREAAEPCAGCRHAAIDHEVNVGDWRCLIDGCECVGFNVVTDGSDDGAVPDVPTRPLAERPIALRAAFVSLPLDEQLSVVGEMFDTVLTAEGVDPAQVPDLLLRKIAAAGRTPESAAILEAAPAPPPPPAVAVAPPPMQADDALPVRERAVPAIKPPPRPPQRDGLAITFARQVLADPPPPGPEHARRLDRPVKRSIVTPKAREYAEAFGLKFSVRLDLSDPDDPTSPEDRYLFVEVLPPDDEGFPE